MARFNNKHKHFKWIIQTIAFVIPLFSLLIIFYSFNNKLKRLEFLVENGIIRNEVDKVFTAFAFKNLKKVGIFRITAFSPSEDECDKIFYITSTGSFINNYTVAASPDLLKKNIFSYGDVVFISRLGKFGIIQDTTNKRFTNTLDVLLPDKKLAKRFGVRSSIVYKLDL